jgi:hypothetical protein
MGNLATMAAPTTNTKRRTVHCSKHAFAPIASFGPKNAVAPNVTLPAQRHQSSLGRAGLASESPFTGDDPVNGVDPMGLYPGEGWVHKALDVVAVPVYALYYGSYRAGKAINDVGCSLGTVGCVISHAVVAVTPTPVFGLPIPVLEATGLAGDAALDWIKNKTTGNGESVFDEDVYGSILPRGWGGPTTWLPGLSKNPCGNINIDFEW